MADAFSRKVEEEFLRYHNQQELKLSPQVILEQTNLISYCRLYAGAGGEEINSSVRDMLDFTNYLSFWFPKVEVIKDYLALFSEQSQFYQLHRWFEGQSLFHFPHVTYSVKTCFSSASEGSRQPKNVEKTIELLNTEPAKAFHLQYGSHYRAYGAIVGTALDDIPKAEAVLSCLDDERIKARFLDYHLTFPEKVQYRMHASNRFNFRDGILRKMMQEPEPDAVLKFIEKNKRRWIAIFLESSR